MPSNANGTGEVVSSTAVVLFKSARAGGEQKDGVLAVTVYNAGSYDALVRANGAHESDEFGLLPAGKSVTFRAHPVAGKNDEIQIDLIEGKRAGSDDTTLAVFVTEWK